MPRGPRVCPSRTSLIGRAVETALVKELLLREDVALVTLTGPGGIGKTRLALQIAAELRDIFAGEVWFVSLAPIRDARQVGTAIAPAMGVCESGALPIAERLINLLRDRQVLLVLDNFEHVIDAATLVAELIEACPLLKILATSRARLRLSAERVVPVAPLPIPANSEEPSEADLLASPAVALFVARAQAVRPDVVIHPPAIAAICRQLDGLPLAIELAASRVDVLPPSALLARLEMRLPLLTVGPRDAPDRQRTMRDAIAWSVDLLKPDEQALFRRLAVFVGGFTLHAAQTVSDLERRERDVFDGVSALVEANLLRPVQGSTHEPRFLLLETIRECGLELLVANNEEDAVREAHAAYFLALAEAAIPHYDCSEAVTWKDRIETELPNCNAALTWAADASIETLIRLTGALCRVWVVSGYPSESVFWIENALTHRGEVPYETSEELFICASGLYVFKSDYPERASAYGQELLNKAMSSNSDYGKYWAYQNLGLAAERLGLASEAESHFRQALDLAAHVRDPENHWAWAMTQVAHLAYRNGDLEAAEKGLKDALASHRKTGNPYGISTAERFLGTVALGRNNYTDSVAHLYQALSVNIVSRGIPGLGYALEGLATVAARCGRPGFAARMLGVVDALRQEGKFWLSPEAEREMDTAETNARRALSDATFETAYAEGQRLRLDEAVAEAMAVGNEIAGGKIATAAVDQREAHGLTPREREVVRELATGRSNREIANALIIGERTVETHVLHILAKLDLESRTAVAAYAIRHDLA